MASFYIAHEIVADNEGGYQDYANDLGNYNSLGQNVGTNWGINAKVYESYLGFPPTKYDMMNMSQDVSLSIFKLNYWDNIEGDGIQNQQVANIFYDGAVNHGVSLMSKFVQRIVNVNDDGIIGPISLNAINASDPQFLYQKIKEKRISFYYFLVENNPSFQVFLNGWLNRMERFADFFFRGRRNTFSKWSKYFWSKLAGGVSAIIFLARKKLVNEYRRRLYIICNLYTDTVLYPYGNSCI